MNTITHIAIHNSGGVSSNPYQSTRETTPDQINAYHKQKWNFPSKYIPDSYGGYNFGYSPITREFHQFRAIGEATAAQKGWNFNTISICVFGNYQKNIYTNVTVDPMTSQIEEDIAHFVLDLINNNARHYKLADNTVLDLSIARVHPHRWYQSNTECYGSGLSDTWITDILSKYKLGPSKYRQSELEQRVELLRKIIALYIQLRKKMQARDAILGEMVLSPFDNKGCTGFID